MNGNTAVVASDVTGSTRRRMVLAILCVSLLIVSLDNTILNIALPALVRDLRATESQLQWIVDVYACVFAGLLLVAGSVGDRFGRKRVLLAGLMIFAAGSAYSAFSGSVTTLISARAIMGVGAACIMPATLSIITDVFQEPLVQARAIGVWSGTTGLGIAIGPIAGGWLLAHFWWGSVFLINVPVAFFGAVAALLWIPESHGSDKRPLDTFGAVLSTSGLAMLLWSIIEAPLRGWDSMPVLLVGFGALVILGGFVAWERRVSHPMLVLEAFGNRRFSIAMAAVALAVFALMGALFVLTQYLQFSLGYSALATGVRILPIAAVLAASALLSTRLDRWLGSKVVVAAGLVIVASGLWRLTTLTVSSGFAQALLGMVLLGLGAGLIIAPATASVMGSLPRERAGVGSATNSTSLQVGGALGVAVIGSVLSSRYQGTLTPLLRGRSVPTAAAHAILGSIGGALTVAGVAGGKLGRELASAARVAFIDGMHGALLVGAIVVALSAVLVVIALPARSRQQTQDPSSSPDVAEPQTAPASASGIQVRPPLQDISLHAKRGVESAKW
jgi:EmrB/QacA subfamily drug resistance transporter